MGLDKKALNIPTIGIVTTRITRYVKFGDECDLPTDGYILCCKSREFKYKPPTVDFFFRGTSAYLRDGSSPTLSFPSEANIVKDGIYEVCFDMPNLYNYTESSNGDGNDSENKIISMYRVLRFRNDRDFPATIEEYQNFQQERNVYKKIYNYLRKQHA